MKKLIVLFLFSLFSPLAHAFIPESGFWGIDAENTGQPGRGFDIDIQASTLALAFYGYRSDGTAQWYLAAGPISNNTFVGNLDTYEGGTAFGTSYKAAQATGSAGTVTVTFSDATHGVITLPGESPKSITRLNFARPIPPDSLTGAYKLVRVVVTNSTGEIIDSATNATVYGSMNVVGNSITQSLSLTYLGQSVSMTLSGIYMDYGSYFTAVTNSGSSSPRLIKRGDEVITFLSIGEISEVDYWYRVSADGNTQIPLGAASLKGAMTLMSNGYVQEPIEIPDALIGGALEALLLGQ